MKPPHPSEVVPQNAPTLLQVSGRQQVPLFRQVAPDAQGPQLAQPPHPSGHVPHCTPICEQVFGVHGTHWFPWQALPGGHWPQSSRLPQPSGSVPH